MKIEERKQQIEDLTKEIREAITAENVDLAKEKREALNKAKELRDLEIEQENEEKRELENKVEERKVDEKMETNIKVNEMRALTKAVLKAEMTVEERAVIKTDANAAVLPAQYINKLEELRKGYGSLKFLCDVIPVNKNTGTMPIVDLEQNTMLDVLEGDDIVEGALVTTDMDFSVSKVGLIDKLSSEVVEDAEIDIQNTVEKNFMEIAIRKENVRILNAINTGATAIVTPVDYTALETVMATALPSVKAGLVTLCNVEGYALLKNMKDTQKRPLNLITSIGDTEYFNGKPIYTFDSSLVTLTEGKTVLFYSLNSKEAIKFFDRKGITIARADKFENDSKMIRVLERFDVKAGTVRSIKKIEL